MNFNPLSPSNVSPPWVLFSLFQLKKGNRFWAFKTMGRSSYRLTISDRMPFGVMLGTGSGNGFGIMPNWRQYALLTCWQDLQEAESFFSTSALAQSLQDRSEETWSVLMQPVTSKGAWEGKNPFSPLAAPLQADEAVVVLTRATINIQRLPEFWNNVPRVSPTTDNAPGLLFKTGLGELPLVQQATISVWKDQQSINNFAYKMQEHKQVVLKTHQRNWYNEELFARFRPVQSWGTVGGENPLPKLATGYQDAG